jgi:calcineurin-like phosphoesterase
MTGSNHIWDKKEIFTVSTSTAMIQPRFPAGTPGAGRLPRADEAGVPVAVVNAMGASS